MTKPASHISRRRALTIMGAVAGLPLSPSLGARAAAPLVTWEGSALGAPARITLAHPDRAAAERLFERCVAEIRRLEALFSLHVADSEISRLNREGMLDAPALDTVYLLSEAKRFGEVTDGAFDISVQPLWRLYAEHFTANPGSNEAPDTAAVDAARALVDFRAIEVDNSRVAFARPGMAVTLNGIAQGYITDKVAALLRSEGIANVLLDLGENIAIDGHPEGRPWRIGLIDPFAPQDYDDVVEIENRAVATSGGYGTMFGADPRNHHLFSPANGMSANHHASVSVLADKAMTADALSTGLFVSPYATAEHAVASLPGLEVRITEANGTKHRLVS
ncbi:MAG: FAD:protein FMN transferase [Alphaproteobacteria bacterium]|jgi:thiamine biosynthesis lipoprotein|nr:FAD:protein FMN transferase [Alphaproteobacteria bacterium]